MRTSKKGGRGGSWGRGSGQSGAPAAVSPVSRYQSDASRRSLQGRLLRGLGWFVLVLIVIGAGIGGGLYLYYNESIDQVNGRSQAVIRTRTLLQKLGSPSDPAVALIFREQ